MIFASLVVADQTFVGMLCAWYGFGIYPAFRYGVRRAVSPLQKFLTIVGFILIGPIAFPIWLIAGTIRRWRRDKIPIGQAFKSQLAADPPGGPMVDVSDDSFILYDSKGREFSRMVESKKADGFLKTRDIVSSAVADKASDILIQPNESNEYNVRYRINGTMQAEQVLPEQEGKAVINIVKAMAGMNIAERRRPQDGGFTAMATHGKVSFRVATAGVMNGEKASLRVLDQSGSDFRLDNVGLHDVELQTIKKAIKGTSGLILMCGPTGSGKSSTVHAMLRSIDSVERNIITIEDPIEYLLPNASQIEVNKSAGITFASVMRSVLRQDPDIIYIGEIRDSETAEIALQAAQTGHLVFATVHAGSNLASLLRLVDLGIQPQLIASAVNLVISQRLVRKLCEHCKTRMNYSAAEQQSLLKQNIDPNCLFGPSGCSHCRKTGFGSRTGVFDVTVMDNELRAQWAKGDITVNEEIHAVGEKQMTTMQIRATQLAMSGFIPWEEVERLTASID